MLSVKRFGIKICSQVFRVRVTFPIKINYGSQLRDKKNSFYGKHEATKPIRTERHKMRNIFRKSETTFVAQCVDVVRTQNKTHNIFFYIVEL